MPTPRGVGDGKGVPMSNPGSRERAVASWFREVMPSFAKTLCR
jgi:hypothetical protein